MKAMITAFLAIGVIAVGAYYVLNEAGFSTTEQRTGGAVRLD